MKVFVYEYCACQPATGGGTTAALRGEGLAMLAAVMEDLGQVPGVAPVALVAADLPTVAFPHQTIEPGVEKRRFLELAGRSRFTLVIAPETDGLLEQRCRWVQKGGGRLLGPDPEAVHLTADKLALAEHLFAHRIPTPATFTARPSWLTPPAVYKPRFGAGSLLTFLLKSLDERERIRRAFPDVEFVLQWYHRGVAASVTFLVGPDVCVPLRPARQNIRIRSGEMSYRGGEAPLQEPFAGRATELAARAVQSVPGLRGYVGVDVVLDRGKDHRDVVIEINPRLTTSYLGLRRMSRVNLAAAMLDAVQGRRPGLRWHHGRAASWTKDGAVRLG